MQSILIADSGSTKTDWIWYKSALETESFQSQGLNPTVLSEIEIEKRLAALPLIKHSNEKISVFFYGAGCSDESTKEIIKKGLHKFLPLAEINIFPDTLAAARAVFSSEEGLVMILGTGSSSCVYKQKRIQQSSTSLGYILGDEGSGNALGKKILQAYFYKSIPNELGMLLETSGIPKNPKGWLINLYQSPSPATYLSEILAIVCTDPLHPWLLKLFESEFKIFYSLHIKSLNEPRLPLGACGSVAWHFQESIKKICAEENRIFSNVVRYPIRELLQYHLTNEPT